MTDLATHTRPEERPDWQQPKQVHRVKAPSRPHPWPESKQQLLKDDAGTFNSATVVKGSDFLTKRFTEVK